MFFSTCCKALLFTVKHLEFKRFVSPFGEFTLLNCSNLFFTVESFSKHVLVTQFFVTISFFTKYTLSFIKDNGILVTLSVKSELLLLHFLFSMFFTVPLLLQHLTLLLCQFSFFLSLELSCVLLPIKNGHGVLNIDAFLFFFSLFTFEFLLGIELP